MPTFTGKLLLIFGTALGTVLGGAIVGSLASLCGGGKPLYTLIRLAQEMKIWAMAVAIGGTDTYFQVLEEGLFSGELKFVVKQLAIIVFAFAGAHAGYLLLYHVAGGKQ